MSSKISVYDIDFINLIVLWTHFTKKNLRVKTIVSHEHYSILTYDQF